VSPSGRQQYEWPTGHIEAGLGAIRLDRLDREDVKIARAWVTPDELRAAEGRVRDTGSALSAVTSPGSRGCSVALPGGPRAAPWASAVAPSTTGSTDVRNREHVSHQPIPELSTSRICARGIHHFVAPPRYGRSMGRPRIYEEPRVATAIRLPASLRDELKAAATERDVSVNFLVTRAVLDYLRRLPAIDPVEPLSARGYRSRAAERATS
jgi:hypothetical protein